MAISAFKSEDATKLLTEILNNNSEDIVEFISKAISKNYSLNYQDLMLKIWEKYNIIDFRVSELIIKDIPVKASQSFSVGLLSENEYKFLHNDYDFGKSDKIIPLMLDNIKSYNSNQLIDICKFNIIKNDLLTLGHFLKFAKENKITAISEVLLEKLQYNNIPYDVFQLTETYLSLNENKNYDKIITILKLNQKDWDKGNWTESFSKLFKEYNINLK